jgi:diguanylate cyclase (GGDEF)-like protein
MEKERLSILIIEDDEDDFVMVRDLLAESKGTKYDLQWVSTYNEALEAINGSKHDLYLFDYRLGKKTGLDLLNDVGGSNCMTPIILLTGQGDHEIDVEAMKAGASDYLAKDEINARLLERSIRYALERKRTEERITFMAYYDNLTSLPNRAFFQDRLSQVIAGNERKDGLSAILFLDLDNFKRVNDTLGHSMGDELLKAVSDRLQTIMRKSDSISHYHDDDLFARLGGDEFTILLSEIKDFQDAGRVAERIIETMSQPFMLGSNEIFITNSIGIALYPNDGEDVDTILKNADAAMYAAKAKGKNSYLYYKKSMNSAALEKLSLEGDLRRALEGDELLLHYQPQMDIASSKVIGVEALIRWQHPEKGLIPPLTFIPVAEQIGLINEISYWVIENACRQNRVWQDKGLSRIPVSVNITTHQFQQDTFVYKLANILNSTGLNPRDLMLEITESTFMENTETALIILDELKKMGLRLLIDDFGTGYSSLSYLKRFLIHAIKIDRSFIRNIVTDKDDTAIVNAIISMAHNLKIRVVAEGVETVEQLAFLSGQDCDEMQGFLLSKPLPPDEVEVFLSGKKVEFCAPIPS